MAGIYVDTSALGRVLLGEPDAGLIRETLARYDPWWSSALLLVELRRLARRQGVEQDGEELLSLVSTQRLDLPALRRSSNLDPIQNVCVIRSRSSRPKTCRFPGKKERLKGLEPSTFCMARVGGG